MANTKGLKKAAKKRTKVRKRKVLLVKKKKKRTRERLIKTKYIKDKILAENRILQIRV